ncbi:hypothetical protein Pse7367_2803 [Thalassoporum mexicanum PCC 7367]|uniref:hypothetical protein n=1 Tax=Thalassoporum mexicanum TaxID=3457544 RepID=UPI00029FA91A|nr:hypothetical protein [Pseudanabaena sp. PCC 7367]AFY71056.1 hypothetical protein Pse7367_2803 [Pseudanabaena sp. PCC 7367]
MASAFLMSLLFLDVGIQVVIFDRMFKTHQRSKQKKVREEEENLTRYESYDTKEQKGWEFKILRTTGGGFRRRKTLKRVCEEEARCGWILLEKLDDDRLRFRRPLAARERDHMAKIDPYRSHYGVPIDLEYLVMLVLVLGIMAAATYAGYKAMSKVFDNIDVQPLPTKPEILNPNSPQPPTP